jgi:hypothetical protein
MNAPDYLSRLRQKNEEKNTPSPVCINPVKDFTQFVQFAHSAKKVDFSEAAPLPKIGAGDTAHLTASEETAIRAWRWRVCLPDQVFIAHIAPDADRSEVMAIYPDAVSVEPLPMVEYEPAKPDPFPDDRRTCEQCANLDGRQCQAAKRGEIVASRDYEPIRDLPRRCEGYAAATPATPATLEGEKVRSVANPENHECRTCEHLKKPGLSDGYCSGRDDLPVAYGDRHPLRECPEDGGASCTAWKLSHFYH